MAKKFKLEEFLLPHEHDGDGKKLEEPKELDVEQLRKWVYGILTDKEEAQEARDAAVADKDAAMTELTELQKKVETDDERRVREQAERDKEIADLRKKDQDRAKVEAIEAHFEDKGITPARAKRLAARVTGDDEKAWLASADELVEDGFRITEKSAAGEEEQSPEEQVDESLAPVRRATRNGKVVAPSTSTKPRSVAEELDAAGVASPGW